MLLLGKVQQTVQCAAWLTEVANREGLHGVRVGVTTMAREQIYFGLVVVIYLLIVLLLWLLFCLISDHIYFSLVSLPGFVSFSQYLR